MKLRPLGDRVLVKRVAPVEKTQGGIVVPERYRELEVFADVVAVGRGKSLDDGTIRPCSVAVGDRVVFGKYAGNDVKGKHLGWTGPEGEGFIMLRDDEILAVVEREPASEASP